MATAPKPLFNLSDLRKQQNKVMEKRNAALSARMKKDRLTEKEVKENGFLVVIRHSKRADQNPQLNPEIFQKWHDSNDIYYRAFDPPICDFKLPVTASKEIKTMMPSFNPCMKNKNYN